MDLAVRGKVALYFDNQQKLQIVKEPLIIVEDNLIVDIGSFDDKKNLISGHNIVGDENQLLIPGLVNCHTHLAMTLFRGLADDLPLDTWLREHIWPLEDKLQATDVYHGAKLGALESIASGVTTVNSMYWFPSEEAKAFAESGLRGFIAAPVITGIATLSEAIKDINKHHDTVDGRIRVCLALHSPYTVTIQDFKDSAEYIKDYNENTSKPELLLHTHLAESKTEMHDSRELNIKHDLTFPDVSTPTEFLHEIGILNENLIAAHCIHLTETDIQLFKNTGARISLNPLSNAKLGNHMPPVLGIIDHVENVGLGTDGPASNNTLDLFDTIRFLALYYKGYYHDPTLVKAEQVFRLATIGGEKAVNWKGIGSLEPNTFADIVTINLKKLHLTPNDSDDAILNHFAYSMKGSDVENVIIDGKLVFENRSFV
ncbi:MAG: amidohydrolase, partial [Candidatus Heimdallarchaeota archaeon]|nr:amidohydrolase [Candidatus Heimdallarchaeota archaeon]